MADGWNDDEWLRRLIAGDEETERQRSRAKSLGWAFVDLYHHRPDERGKGAITDDLAWELRVLPLVRDGNTLWVAFAEPNSFAEARIAAATSLRVIPVLCVRAALDAALKVL